MGDSTPDNSQVSGFYGPGSWAAWVIMLVSSWILIILNDYDKNVHFIAYALYTNWAAIHLVMMFCEAAGAVVFVGTIHGLLQGFVGLFKLPNVPTYEAERKLKKRICIIYLGLLLPFPLSIYHLFTSHRLMVGVIVILTAIMGLFRSEGLGFRLMGILPDQMFFALLLFSSMYPAYSFLLFALVLIPGMKLRGNGSTLPSIGSLLSDRCHYIPCAPQKINEWDQLFSLLVALFLFFYEFQNVILVLSRRLLHTIGDTYTKLFQSSSQTSASRLEQDVC